MYSASCTVRKKKMSLSRLAQLKRQWPFDPRPDRTVSAVQHARRGTFDKLLHSKAVSSEANQANGTQLTGMALDAHDVAASSAADAKSTSDADSDSTHTVQQPRKRIRITPTGMCLHLPWHLPLL
jgi:hypothetical protein